MKKRRRIFLILISFALIIITFFLVLYAFKDGGIEFFRSPTQVNAENISSDEVFRLGGLVVHGSVVKNGPITDFVVSDGMHQIPVRFSGILPDLFSEGTGMIAKGQLSDGVFLAEEVLAKHDENYMPKEVADALKEQGIYNTNGLNMK